MYMCVRIDIVAVVAVAVVVVAGTNAEPPITMLQLVLYKPLAFKEALPWGGSCTTHPTLVNVSMSPFHRPPFFHKYKQDTMVARNCRR
jgi:hypothetical protein